MNLVFVGASKFGLRCLELVSSLDDVTVKGVLTAPEKFSISYRPEGVTNVLYADVASFARSRKIPCKMLSNGMNDPALLAEVDKWQPEAFLVVGWYHMIPSRWRERAPAYGLHASLLPDYSGGAPLVWAIINGENKTGITLFQMDEGVDSGPIVAQAEETIRGDDTIASLYARIEERGLELLKQFLPVIAKKAAVLSPQDETERRIFPQRSPADGCIDWGQDAQYIERFIRAQTRPYPGAFTTLNGRQLTIWAASHVRRDHRLAGLGHVSFDDGCYFVQCSLGAILLEEVAYEGRSYGRDEIQVLLGAGGQSFGG